MSGYEHLAAGQVEQARKRLALFAFQPNADDYALKVAAVLTTLDRAGVQAAHAQFISGGLKTW
jgi:hypothetical protein